MAMMRNNGGKGSIQGEIIRITLGLLDEVRNNGGTIQGEVIQITLGDKGIKRTPW